MSAAANPDIVANLDDLLLCLDGSDLKSYSDGSSTWYDRSSNSLNATFANTIAYESTPRGGIELDGGNEDIRIVGSSKLNHLKSGDFTVETIVRSDDKVYPRSRHPFKIGHTVTGFSNKGWSVGHQQCNNNIEVRVCDGTNRAYTDLSHSALEESTYYHRIFTVSRDNGCATTYYLNNEEIGTHNATSVTGEIYDPSQSSDFGPAGGIMFGYVWGWRFIGVVNVIRIYKKVLSESEILQNFNATKSKYNF